MESVAEVLPLILSNPNVAYLLFLLGLLGITAELYHPGALVPGTLGVASLLLALVGFGNLPISWAGIVLVLCAIGLFIGELHTGVGALAIGGLIAFILGSLLLYRAPIGETETDLGTLLTWGGNDPRVRVAPWLIALMATLTTLFFLVVIRAALRARGLAVRTGIPVLIGKPGIALSELAVGSAGTVRVDGEVWSAELITGGSVIHSGERIEVIGAGGVTLRVRKAESASRQPPYPYRRGEASS